MVHGVGTWSTQQEAALSAVGRWLKAGSPQIFRLFGFAGAGKTTLARHIAESSDGTTVFGAFTGKAALVMRAKGCDGARTIHSLIYTARDSASETPVFVLNESSPAASADLIVIDECSMVDQEIGRDLLSFGKPVLVLGDPAQLPPVSGAGFFTDAPPDAMLTDVHRQAADNPIIRLSMAVREGGRPAPGEFGDLRILARRDLDTQTVLKSDQILVGLNRSRHRYNTRLRQLNGIHADLPEAGDKLVCLKNNRKKGLLNGSLWRVQKMSPRKGEKLRMTLVSEDEPERAPLKVSVLADLFMSETPPPFEIRKNSDEFDFGYALTVHKAQGSQWRDVVVFDESAAFREHRSRWLYTAITRAEQRLTVVL